MAYVRKHGNQLTIVHGGRDPETQKVEQEILFTIYSQREARAILGKGAEADEGRFRFLLEDQYSDITISWDKIYSGIEKQIDHLPENHEYQQERLLGRFGEDLMAFSKQLMLADPQHLQCSGDLIRLHRYELEFLSRLIEWRLELCDQDENEWNRDNPFFWRFSMQGRQVPVGTEEMVTGYYERGELERADALFRLLVNCFDNYADGYNYRGLIAYEQDDLQSAEAFFKKTIEVGRKLFPKRIAKSRYWSDHITRPYIRGLRNLALTLNERGRYDEALALADRLEEECDDDLSAASLRAAVFLNTTRWKEAETAAAHSHNIFPGESFIAGFAAFEQGRVHDARSYFLHGALNYPRSARMLTKTRTRKVNGWDDARDHNNGVSLARSLHDFLARQSRSSKRFFKSFISDEDVKYLLDEVVEVSLRWHEERGTEDRTYFDRMTEMKTKAFAEFQAELLFGFPEPPAIH